MSINCIHCCGWWCPLASVFEGCAMLTVSILNFELFGSSHFQAVVYKREAIEYTPHVPKTRRSQCVPITRMSMTRRVKEQYKILTCGRLGRPYRKSNWNIPRGAIVKNPQVRRRSVVASSRGRVTPTTPPWPQVLSEKDT